MADPTDEREGLVIPFSVPEFERSARSAHYAGLESRVKQLRDYCEEDRVRLRVKSEDDFWAFLESPQLSLSTNFDVVATDDGNLRAIYDENGVHIGVEFFGDQYCECVVWSADTPPTGARTTMAHALKLTQNLLH